MADRVVRVEIETDDGKITRLTGNEAERWGRDVAYMEALAVSHGFKNKPLKWETVQDSRTRRAT